MDWPVSHYIANLGYIAQLCYIELGDFKNSSILKPEQDHFSPTDMVGTGCTMSSDDDHFDDELCEELALELLDQQTPVDQKTKDKDSKPPTVPAKTDHFLWGKKKGKIAVRKFFKDRQYLPDVKPDVRKKAISGLFAHARNRARKKILAAWLLPGIFETRASLHETLEAHEDCGELVSSQEARDDASQSGTITSTTENPLSWELM